MPRDVVAIAGAPDQAGGRSLAAILEAHGIPAELRDAGSGFVDVVVPHAFRDEGRKLLKAHLDALARDEAPEVIGVTPDSASDVALVGALRAAGFPATTSRRGVYASGQGTSILVPHALAAAAREFLAALEAEGADAGPARDEREKEHEETVPAAERAVAESAAVDDWSPSASADGSGEDGVRDVDADAAGPEPAAEEGPADEGPPAYASDLKPDFGADFGSFGGGL